MKPPDYTFDETRLATLEGYRILDTPADAGFDDIVHLAAYLCACPVSLVSFVAENRQWFKARVGFEPCETDLGNSVCAHALIEPDLLIIEDLSTDPRTKANPLVAGEPHIRFYAGAPLRAANGHVLGSLCVIDGKPRPGGLTAAQAESLRNLARQVMSQMELRRAVSQRDALLADNRRAEVRRNGLLTIGDRLRALNTVPEATHVAAKIVGETLDVIRAGFGRIDATGAFIDVEADWAANGFVSRAGRHGLADYGDLRDQLTSGEPLVVDDVLVDPRTAALADSLVQIGVRAMANLPVRDRGGGVALFFAHSDQPRVWAPEDLTFLHNVGDRVAASVARSEAEAVQRLLNLELSHRMKNTFAVVQAIATQSLRGVPDQTPVRAFAARLQAFSAAHDVLLQQNWQGAKMGDVVKEVLEAVEKIDRFTLKGPHVAIGPRATLSLSLLLHELSTNALKYGALSQPTGHVDVAWEITNGAVALRWREVGGPPVQAPTRKGFGSRLIDLGLAGTGGARTNFASTGFEADFEAPLSQLQET